MARDRTPIVKRSRREGVALHPKAHKVMMRRKNPPGFIAASRRRPQVSQYGLQLREKQKVKRIYGVLEKPFRRLISEAEGMSGVTGANLLQLLERRLDNTVYRAGLAVSRQAARQLVTHGHFLFNDRRVDIPSIRVNIGDEIKVRPASAKNHYFMALKDQLTDEQLLTASWLSVNPKTWTAKVTALPSRDAAEPDISEQLIVEFYSR
ncbi:30S ribosomal protein S4 [Candidatus Microgenomates bacterium]|nr:30S ribosomal protein S4 [Candidatus Microgenomates bacterium]